MVHNRMRILIISPSFSPSVGGIETVSRDLSAGLVERGHAVTVLTETRGCGYDPPGVRLVRGGGWSTLRSLLPDHDVVLLQQFSLRWAMRLRSQPVRRPVVVAMHNWLWSPDRAPSLRERWKKSWVRRMPTIVVSRILREHLGGHGLVIANGFSDRHFFPPPDRDAPRVIDFAFVGRLVSDKGAEDLIGALSLLARDGWGGQCAILGDGPERTRLEEKCAQGGIVERVDFHASAAASIVGEILRQTRVVVVPSRWHEPFGLVAIEAMACGCPLVVTERGALPGIVGDAGRVVPMGDVEGLAAAMKELVEPVAWTSHSVRALARAERFRPERQVDRYLEVLRAEAGRGKRQ